MDPTTVGELIDAAVRRNPARLAIVDRHRRLDYEALGDEVARAARVLANERVRRGTTVAASAANGIDVLVAFLATMQLGARWTGINRNATETELEHLLRDSRARVLLTDRDELEVDTESGIRTVFTLGTSSSWRHAVDGANARPPTSSPDPLACAAIAYTSGTTGRPKGVMHSQHNLTLPGRYLATTSDFDDSSVVGIALPLTTLNVIVVSALPTLIAGRPCVLVPKVEAATIAAWIAQEGITNLSVPPPALYDLATRDDIQPSDLATLRSPRTGGSDLPDATRSLFAARFGREVVGTYGLTEAPALVAAEARDQPRVRGASGQVMPYLEVRIVDADGNRLPTGQTGEISLAGRSDGPWRGAWRPMLGYWRRPAASRMVLREGGLLTGDIGRLDAQGNLYVLDRLGSMVNRGGANVYPAEIERTLRDLPGVIHSAVVGVPDARLGERVAVAIEADTDIPLSRDAVLDHCRSRLAKYKVPEIVVFVAALPRNSAGKVVLPAVRETISAAARTSPPRSAP